MVTIPNLEKYRQGDFIQYMNNVLQILDQTRAGQFNILPQREQLQTWLARIKDLNNSFDEKYVARAQAVSGQQPGFIQGLMSAAMDAFRQLKSLFEARFAVAEADAQASVPDFRQIENEWSSLTRQYNDSVTRLSGTGQPAPPETGMPVDNAEAPVAVQ